MKMLMQRLFLRLHHHLLNFCLMKLVYFSTADKEKKIRAELLDLILSEVIIRKNLLSSSVSSDSQGAKTCHSNLSTHLEAR